MVLDVLMLVLHLVFWLDVLFDALCWFFMAILLLMFALNALGCFGMLSDDQIDIVIISRISSRKL